MLIDEMQHRLDLELDRLASQDRPDLYPNEKDDIINRAIYQWLKDRFEFDPNTKKGFETNNRAISSLMSLHIKSNPGSQNGLIPINLNTGLYEIRLNNLLHEFMFLTSAKVKISNNNCDKVIDNKQWQIDDNKNAYNEPNFDWGRVHANFGRTTENSTDNEDLTSIYFDSRNIFGEPQFTVDEVYINYIKKPNRVCLGTYKHIDDKTASALTPISHCDIDKGFHDEIITIAAKLAFKDIQDKFGYQTSLQEQEKYK